MSFFILFFFNVFSEDFTFLLFHYDGRTTEWDEFEWSKRAIHVSVRRQTKWWYAKRFLHPDIVAPYDYIFIWDEDLGVEHFNAEESPRKQRRNRAGALTHICLPMQRLLRSWLLYFLEMHDGVCGICFRMTWYMVEVLTLLSEDV
ncbi:unnamed protein product, partial [Vitis vinifera]|uniref:Uncharacterized protein n=1 Tax=Vitis vinifera TaxID=29760 RepID=D7SYE9_VITVI